MLPNLPFKISVILSTFNRPDALYFILFALNQQTYLPQEVIVADDGSTKETFHLIEQIRPKLNYSLRHVWQRNKGFRVARIRNKSVLVASHDYLIFLDGDCVPFPDFIEKHRYLAEYYWFVTGHRILLSPALTQRILKQTSDFHTISFWKWLLYCLKQDSNSPFPLLRVPLKNLRKLQPKRWTGVKSCNLALWKKDFIGVNGFDENFIGWGYEDSDLVIRLIRSGIHRKTGKWVIPVLHLWHPKNNNQQEITNLGLLKELKKCSRIHAKLGLGQHSRQVNTE